MSRCARFLVAVVILSLSAAGCGASYSGKKSPVASSGLLDLRDWDFKRDGSVRLSGEWEFYWKQLLGPDDFDRIGAPRLTASINLPGYWNELSVGGKALPVMGYATHRLKILLPEHAGALAIRNTAMATSFRLFVDGRSVRCAGEVGTDAESSRPEYEPGVVPVAAGGREMTLIMQVSNFHHYHGGAGEALILGNEGPLISQWKKLVFFELFLFGSIIIIGLYHFGVFLLMRKDKSPLFFGLLCFCIAFFNQFSGELFFYKLFLNDLGWAFRFLVINLCVYFMVPSLLMFISYLFPEEVHKRIIPAVWIVAACFSAFALATPTYIYAWGFALFQILLLTGFTYCFVSLVRASFRKRHGALIMLAGFACFFITAIIDALSYNNIIPFYVMSSAVGLFLFIFSQAYLLSDRYAIAFRAEERLARDLRSVIENIQDVFYRSDARGNLIMASPSFLTLLGYDSLDECLGKPIAETFYYDPETRGEFLRLIREKGNVTNYEVVLKKRDGAPVIIEASSHLYHDDKGVVAGIEGVFRDITERKRAAEALLASQRQMKAIVDGSPVPQFVIDRSHTVIHWNRALAEYSGIREEDVIGTNRQWRAFYGSERPCMADLLVDGLTDDISRWYAGKYSSSRLLKDAFEATDFFPEMRGGTWLFFTAAPLYDGEGKILGAVETLVDISERKEAEKRLEVSLDEKETLLRELYHRTKNTMQVIRSMLFLQAAKSPDNGELQKMVKDMENRILTMSLVHEKLYQSSDLSRIDMRDYIDGLAHLILESYSLTEEQIALKLDIEPISMLLDTAIPCGLILNELLTNAIKYAFSGGDRGEISIRLSRNESNNLELRLADNGAGVPEGFDFRKQETLGLQSIIAIAEHQMQGRVSFTTDHGVTCVIEFPDTLYKERV